MRLLSRLAISGDTIDILLSFKERNGLPIRCVCDHHGGFAITPKYSPPAAAVPTLGSLAE